MQIDRFPSTRNQKLLLGAATFWPIVYMLLFMVVSLIMFVSMVMFAGAATGGPPPAPLPMAGPAGVVSIAITILFAVVFLLHCFTMVEGLCLLAYYIYHVFTTDRLPEDKKALWAVVIFLGSAIAMPIYWYLYIWKEPQAASGAASADCANGSGVPPSPRITQPLTSPHRTAPLLGDSDVFDRHEYGALPHAPSARPSRRRLPRRRVPRQDHRGGWQSGGLDGDAADPRS